MVTLSAMLVKLPIVTVVGGSLRYQGV